MLKVSKIIAPVAALLFSSPLWAGISVEPFPDASNYSLIVTENADLGSGVHVHGGLYVGGNLTYSGANGSAGSDISDDATGLVVGGDILATQQLDLMGTNYYIGGSYSVPLNNAGDELSSNPVTASDVTGLLTKSTELGLLGDSGVVIDSSDINGIDFDLTSGELNVINLDDSNAAYLSQQNAALTFTGFTTDTYLLVNYDLSSNLNFVAKFNGLSESAYSNILWNFTGSSELTFANSVSTFKGSILAPQSSVVWNANDIDGQLVAQNLTWSQTSQSHHYTPWDKAGDATQVPLPSIFWLFSIGLALIWRQHAKPSH